MSKKPFLQNEKTLKRGLTKMSQYSRDARQPTLVIYRDRAGIQFRGTKNMCKWFREQLETTNIDEIAKLETKTLNSENYREVIDTLYATNDQQEFTEDPTPKLPCPSKVMTEKQCRKWLLPELHKDVEENYGKRMSRMKWSDQAIEPKCWESSKYPWKNKEAVAEYLTKNGLKFVDVLQECVRNRCRNKGIDPNEHVEEVDSAELAKKLKSRGKKVIPTASEVAVEIEEASANEEAFVNEEAFEAPIHHIFSIIFTFVEQELFSMLRQVLIIYYIELLQMSFI